MIIYAHDDGGKMVIDAKKYGEQYPVHCSIFNEYFDEDFGMIPFEWFDAMKSKDKTEYLNECKQKKIYYE